MASPSAKYAVIGGIAAVAIAIGIGLALVAPPSTAPTETPAPIVQQRAALVMGASIDDIGWGTLHHRGLLVLEDELGYEVALSEKVAPASWETAARDYAERGFDYVIMGGPQFTDVTINVAPDYPDTTFIVTAAVPPAQGTAYPDNVVGIDPINEQSGYLAGILAGGMTKTNKVGIVAGFDFPNLVRMYEAFKLGVVTENPDAEILEVFIGSFEDVSKGYEAGRSQIDAGADVIFQDLDRAAFGVVNAVEEKPGVLLIGNTNDQVFLAPKVTLTSALMNHTDLIVRSVKQLNSGELSGGEFYRWGIDEGPAGIAPYHETEDMIPSELKAKIASLTRQMADGTFVVPEIYEKGGYKQFVGMTSPSIKKAALVMDASIDDIGWGTSHHQGLLALKERFGYEISLSEQVPPAEWETATRDYAERDYDYIIMAGAQFTDLIIKIGPEYPSTTFIVVTAVPPLDKPYPSNMVGLDIINEQSGYLAGVLAGGMTNTDRIGIVSGIDYPNVIRWNEGFKLGAVTENPDVTIFETFTGSWDDVSKGYEATRAQLDAGADVIWQYLDLGAVGAANAVKEKPGVLLISNTNDQSFLAPEATLTSALQGIPNLIVRGVQDLEAGNIHGGEFYRWGINEDVAGLAPYHETEDMIPSELKAKIASLTRQMADGTFVVPEIYEKQGYRDYL